MPAHPGTTTPIESPSLRRAKSKTAIPTAHKFSFKSAFASKTSKNHVAAASASAIATTNDSASTPNSGPSSPTKRKPPTAATSEPQPKSTLPAASADSLGRSSKLPTSSSSSMRTKPTGGASDPFSANLTGSLGKRSVQATAADQFPATSSAASSTVGGGSKTGEFGSVAKGKIALLKTKLPGPPPARFGTFSGHTSKSGAASPLGKPMKIARSNSLKDVHGTAALQSRLPQQQSPERRGATISASSSNSSLRNAALPRPATGSIPKSRSRTGLSLVQRNAAAPPVSGDEDARKRTQSVTEGMTTPSPRKATRGLPVLGGGANRRNAEPSGAGGEGGGGGVRANTLNQVSNTAATIGVSSLRRLHAHRRPSSIDLGKPSNGGRRRTSIDEAASAAVAAESRASRDKENQASAKSGPPPSFAGSGSKTVARSSAAIRYKRSSLPVATAPLGNNQVKASEQQTQPSPLPEAVNADADPDADVELRKQERGQEQELGPDPNFAPSTARIGQHASTGNLAALAAGEKPSFGITQSVLKAHPITHPAVLAMRQKTPHQPIDTPQALLKGRKRLSGVLGNPLDLVATMHASGKSGAAAGEASTRPAPRPRTARPCPGPNASASTPPASPSKSRARAAVTFPTKGSSPIEDPNALAKPPAPMKPNGRALSSAEIDADLLASLQAVARKANLNMREVETMMAADKMQREAELHDDAAYSSQDTQVLRSAGSKSTLDVPRGVHGGREPLERTMTPSLSEMALSGGKRAGLGRTGRQRSDDKGLDDELPTENIGDQSLDLLAIQSSPLGGESPLLRSSDGFGAGSADGELEELGVSAMSDRFGGLSPSLRQSRRHTADERIRRALRESVGLESMLGTCSPKSRPLDSLLGVELHNTATSGRKTKAAATASTEKQGEANARMGGMLMDESFVEELAMTVEEMELDQSHAARPAAAAASPMRRSETPEKAAAEQRLRQVEETHARQLADAQRELNELRTQLDTLRLASPAPAPAPAPAVDETALAELQTALEAAQSSLATSEAQRLELQSEQQRLKDRMTSQAAADQARRDWAAIKKIGLVELQDVQGQMDQCIFWMAQLEWWEGMVRNAVGRIEVAKAKVAAV
ncbi:hypothetical protein ACQY0O_003587 [Thecaphora frezii]